MSTVLIARQPILDRTSETLGYELLFRAAVDDDVARIVDGDAATAAVIQNAITEFGLDALVGDRLAFINLTVAYLANADLLETLPPDACVLEILEKIDATDDVIANVAGLQERGFVFALDDFEPDGPTAPLAPFVDFVKYDFEVMDVAALTAAIELDHAADRRVIIERIETEDDHRVAFEAGADFFQGYYFARPTVMESATVSSNALALIRMLAEINQPDASIETIVTTLSQDVAMSVKTLKFVNSAAHGLSNGVGSIAQAAVLVGRDVLRCWAMLELLSSLGSKPAELAKLSLIRAKFCELTATTRGFPDVDSFYTVGMLSLLDALTGTSMQSIVDRIGVSDAIRIALLRCPSPYTDVLDLAVALEQHSEKIALDELDAAVVANHLEASRWANELFTETTRRLV